MIRLNRVVLIIVAGCVLMSTGSVSGQEVKEIVQKVLKDGVQSQKQFDTVFDFIVGTSEDEKWRAIPWVPDLWEGRKLAAEKGKPLFVWAMNGDPLGCV